MLKPEDFFDESKLMRRLFAGTRYVWEGLTNIESYISSYTEANVDRVTRSGCVVTESVTLENGAMVHEGAYLEGMDIEIGPGSVVEPGAYIRGPAIIGSDNEIRHGAYIRGNVLTGPGCVIGHATEVKNSALLGGSQAGHFAYIGDSILGSVNLGAGTKLANLKMVDSGVKIRAGGEVYQTGLRKFGAIIGDGSQTGCNSVTAPGTIMSRNVLLYPGVTAVGFFGPGKIIKLRQKIEQGDRR